MATSLRSQVERESSVDDYKAVQVADAGISLAMARLTQGNTGAIGSEETPWDFGAGDCQATVVDNDDGTFTITSLSEVSGESAAVEAIVAFAPNNEVYSNAVFAGNDSEDNGYVLKINGMNDDADEIYGDVYSGGSVNFMQDAFIDGTPRATEHVLGSYGGEEGVTLALPDLPGMNYEATATFNVNDYFDGPDAFYSSAPPGGSAWQMPEDSPAHIFRKNPSDRSSRLNMTPGDDFFLEDPYEPNGRDSGQTGVDPSEITLSGVNGAVGPDSNQAVFYIHGNLWMDNAPTFSFRFKHGLASGIQVTFVVRGNIYFGDNLFYEDEDMDGVAFIAMEDPDVADSGNISFGDPTGGTLKEMHAFMYAENDFIDINLDQRGSESVRLYGNMTAGNQVDIQRDHGSRHTKLIVDFDSRIMDGDLDQPGLPGITSDESAGRIQVLSWRLLPDSDQELGGYEPESPGDPGTAPGGQGGKGGKGAY